MTDPHEPAGKPRDISHELFAGALVDWLHTPRGGYGFTIRVPAKIVALNLMGTIAVIEVKTASGATVRRRVAHVSLRQKRDR